MFSMSKIGDNDFSIRIDNQKKEWYFKVSWSLDMVNKQSGKHAFTLIELLM